jgi:hypothetical protein
MTALYEILPNNYACTAGFDNHIYVKNFKNNVNVDDKKTLIDAYIVRDLYYTGETTLKKLFEKYCIQLHLNLSDEKKKQIREYEFLESITKMMRSDNFVDEPLQYHYNKFVNREDTNREIENRSKYNIIMQMIEQNKNIEELYNVFSLEELYCIGW